MAADHPPAWHAIHAPRVPGFELQPQALSLQLAASSKAWLRLLQLAGGAADPCSSPTGSLVAKHYWDPTDLNKFSSWFRLSWSRVPQKSFPAVFYLSLSIPPPYSAHLKASVALPLFSQHLQVNKLWTAPFFLLLSGLFRLPLSACLTSSPPFHPFPHRFTPHFGLCCQRAVRVVLDTKGWGYTQTHTQAHRHWKVLRLPPSVAIPVTVGRR